MEEDFITHKGYKVKVAQVSENHRFSNSWYAVFENSDYYVRKDSSVRNCCIGGDTVDGYFDSKEDAVSALKKVSRAEIYSNVPNGKKKILCYTLKSLLKWLRKRL